MGIFNKFAKKKYLEDTEDFEKGLASILEFLANVGRDIKVNYDLCMKVKSIREKERSEIDSKKQIKLLCDEIKSWDDFLEKFVMLKRDTDIAGQRAKKISNILKEEAEKLKVDPDIKKMIKTKDEWNFNW